MCIDYVEECEELLSQSDLQLLIRFSKPNFRYVKLKPSNPKAWTELGNCLLKKPDIESALESLKVDYIIY